MRQVFHFSVSPQVVVGSRIASWMQTSYFSAVSANLFAIAASGQIPHAQRGPPELGHYSRQTPKSARSPIALWDFEKIQQRLTADALQPIKKVDLAVHAFQRHPPGVAAVRRFFCCSSCSRSRNDIAISSSRLGGGTSPAAPAAAPRTHGRLPDHGVVEPLQPSRRETLLKRFVVLDEVGTELRCHHAAGVFVERRMRRKVVVAVGDRAYQARM